VTGAAQAMSEATRVGLSAVVLAAGAAALAGVASLLLTHALARRSTIAATWLAPVLVVVMVAAGVLASARSMVLGSDQVVIMAVVLGVSATVAVGFGVLLASRLRRAEAAHAAAAAARERDAAVEAKRQELVRWVSHDLRTPLGRMRAMTEALRDGLVPDPGTALRQLDTEVDGLSALVDDLLVLSRLTSREAPLQLQPIDVADLLSDAIAGTALQARGAGVALVGDSEPGLVVAADPTELNRALGNLLTNALRHTRPGGTVAVHGRRWNGRCVVEVSDECGGIPGPELALVFEPGWRGDQARTPTPDARAGLGLAIAANVVQRHSGQIGVANHGTGCRFRIELPLAAG
jgi:signal transduction histidine kinase